MIIDGFDPILHPINEFVIGDSNVYFSLFDNGVSLH